MAIGILGYVKLLTRRLSSLHHKMALFKFRSNLLVYLCQKKKKKNCGLEVNIFSICSRIFFCSQKRATYRKSWTELGVDSWISGKFHPTSTIIWLLFCTHCLNDLHLLGIWVKSLSNSVWALSVRTSSRKNCKKNTEHFYCVFGHQDPGEPLEVDEGHLPQSHSSILQWSRRLGTFFSRFLRSHLFVSDFNGRNLRVFFFFFSFEWEN